MLTEEWDKEGRRALEKKEPQTNSEGGNIINTSTETIKQCKYEKCQDRVHEPAQEWNLPTSDDEDKRQRAGDAALRVTRQHGQSSGVFWRPAPFSGSARDTMFPLRGREVGREGAGRVFKVNQKDYELGTREAACLEDIFPRGLKCDRLKCGEIQSCLR